MKERSAQMVASGIEMRLRIVETLSRILETQQFESVTVNKICQEVDIARSTFYYYFDDKFDVVQWHFDYVAELYLFEVGRTLTWLQAGYRNTQAVMRLKSLYIGAFTTRGYQSIFSYSKRRRVETLTETIVDYHHEKMDDALEMQVFALAEAEGACMSRWFKQGMPYDVEHLARYLEGIVPQRLHDLLNDPVDPQLY